MALKRFAFAKRFFFGRREWIHWSVTPYRELYRGSCTSSHGSGSGLVHTLQSPPSDKHLTPVLPLLLLREHMTPAIYLGGFSATPLAQRILHFPLTRILLSLIFFMVPFLLIQAGATHFFEEKLFSRIGQLLGVGVGCLSYAFYVLKIEKREVSELALPAALQEYGAGFLLGGLMVGISLVGIAVLGGVRAMSFAPGTTAAIIALPLMMHITVGILEEMLMRVIFFRIVQEYLGSWLALLASGLVFGALHMVNDNVSVLGIADIAVAGVFFAAAFLLTGRIWLCAALHAGWNFFQDGIFSLAVSGHEVKQGLLVTELGGPDWLTGGAFGLEGSAVDLVFVILASVVLLVLAQRMGRIVQPIWKR